MPLLEKGELNGLCSYTIWKVGESEDFFIRSLSSSPDLLSNCLEVSHPKRRLEMLASRFLLSTYLRELGQVELFIEPSGKPILKGVDQFISISHNRDMVAVAISETAVGIDVLYRDSRMEHLHSKFTTTSELSENDVEREDALHLIWSAKESAFKAYGKGGLDYKRDILVRNMTAPKSDWQSAEVYIFPELVSTRYLLYYQKSGDLFVTLATSKQQAKGIDFQDGSY